jgi:adenylate cyclase
MAGVSLLSVRRLWRALGFPRVGDEPMAFADGDLEALARTVRLVRGGTLDEDTAIAVARALGQTSDRLVNWQIEVLAEHVARHGAPADSERTLAAVDALADDLEHLLVYSWRRHLAAAVSRLALGRGQREEVSAGDLTVGFADLVSFTRLSQRLSHRQLGVLVQRFEALAADVVTGGGGRVIKTVGDEVLFTAVDPRAGAVIALSLSERMAVDDVVPDVRVGLAHGRVLRSQGDVFGGPVNLASRLTALAEPGTVVTEPVTAQGLAGSPHFVLVPQRARQVRGFGQVQPLLIARAGPGGPQIPAE